MCVEMSDKCWDFGTQKSVQVVSGQIVPFDWKAGVVVRTRPPQVAKVTLNVLPSTTLRPSNPLATGTRYPYTSFKVQSQGPNVPSCSDLYTLRSGFSDIHWDFLK